MLEQPMYAISDREEIRELIRTFGWAVLVSSPPDSGPVVSHLPVVLDETGPGPPLAVSGHLAAGDAPAHRLGSAPSTVIIEGPNAYVSPRYYGSPGWVPTWNFVVVHLHGRPKVLDADGTLDVLERTVEHFEHRRGTGWRLEESAAAVPALLPQVTGFRLVPDRIVAKAKLSQDKPPAAVAGVIRGLEGTGRPADAALAAWMRRRQS